MKKYFLTAVSAVVLSGLFSVQAQDGFVVWAEGSHCDRELKFNKLESGKVGAKQTAVKKGAGADIHPAISYDGVWVAFSRFKGTPKGQYDGPCDYHSYTDQTIFIAKIDNGKNLPAQAIEVGYGCWSSWAMDENAKNPSAPKTLYYTTHQDKDIKKIVIQPDGSFSKPATLHKLPSNTKYGSSGHIMASPDGRYVAIRPSGIQVWDSKTGKMVSGSGGGGCHPSWGPRSKYLMWSKNLVCRVEDGATTMKGTKAGTEAYWQAFSNDEHYDKGKVWIIARMSGGGKQNTAGSVEFREVDISGGSWKYGSSTKVGSGTACDIHVYGANGPVGVAPKAEANKLAIESNFNTTVTSGANGLQLVIESDNAADYTAGLYDLTGKQRASMTLSASKNIMPLHGIATGKYILKLSNSKVSTQKAVWISR